MTVTVIAALCSILFGALGFLIAYFTFLHGRKKDAMDDGQNKGAIASDIGYIKAGVDDLKREGRETRALVSELTQRVTRCEESCKQAHHRIDEWRNTTEH